MDQKQKQKILWAILNPIVNYIIIYWLLTPSKRSLNENIILFIIVVIGTYIWRNIKYFSELTKKSIRSIVWTAWIVAIGLVFYVNHSMPHGEYYPTGEYDDETGRQIYWEDMIDLNIPEWAKFIRANTNAIFIGGLLVAISIDTRTKKGTDD